MTGFAPRPSETGFTLVEMLVALVIFGLVAAAGTALLASSVDARDLVAKQLDRSSALRRVDALAAQDFAAALPRPVLGGRGAVPAFQASDGTLVFALTRGGVGGASNNARRPGVRRVAWRLVDGELSRRIADAADTRDEGAPVVLARGVTSASVAMRGEGAWQNQWHPVSPETLPRAVDLRLSFDDGRTASLRFAMGPGS